jgi:hypothetical protein
MTQNNDSAPTMEPIVSLYNLAKDRVRDAGYGPEIDYVQKRTFADIDETRFFEEYCFVVLCWGVREQIGRQDYDRFMERQDPKVIKNRFRVKKQQAVTIAKENFVRWFGELKCSTRPEKYLRTLPLIGEVMKWHLARNLGFDCVKPDRHMNALASEYGFSDPWKMCERVQKYYPNDRLGTIDVVFWRWCNLGRPS